MKFIITGGSGFVGKKVAQEIMKYYGPENNEYVYIMRNKELDFLKSYISDYRIKIVKGDIVKIDNIKNIFDNVDFVIHIAGYLGYGHPSDEIYKKNNVEGAENIFRLGMECKVKKIIYLSTAGIYHPTGDKIVDEQTILKEGHTTRYTYSKYLGYLKSLKYIKKGAPIINILPVSVYGENSPLFKKLVNQIKKNNFLFIPKFNSKLSLLYVGDLATSTLRVMEKGKIGESYILSGQSFSLKDIANMIAKSLEKKIKIIEIPKIFAKIIFKVFDIIIKIFKIKLYYNSEFYNFIEGGLVSSHEKAISKLQHKESNIEDNILKMANSYD